MLPWGKSQAYGILVYEYVIPDPVSGPYTQHDDGQKDPADDKIFYSVPDQAVSFPELFRQIKKETPEAQQADSENDFQNKVFDSVISDFEGC